MSDSKPLIDDLADVLVRMVVGWQDVIGHDLAQHPDVQRVMARYRARGETPDSLAKTTGEESDG